MANIVKFFRSIVSGNVPTLTQIQSYIFATNTADGKLFLNNSTNTKIDSLWFRSLDYSARSYVNLTGGGTVIYDTNGVSWSQSFVITSNSRTSENSTAGMFLMDFPANGTVITGVGGKANVTVANGRIPLASWDVLYYVLPLGSGSASVAANYRVSSYTATFDIPPNWIPIAIVNGDGIVCKFTAGYVLDLGESYDATTSLGVRVNAKANSVDVYTKKEVDVKNDDFLQKFFF